MEIQSKFEPNKAKKRPQKLSNAGHVNEKGGNWQNGRPYIAELLYPDFYVDLIHVGSDSTLPLSVEKNEHDASQACGLCRPRRGD